MKSCNIITTVLSCAAAMLAVGADAQTPNNTDPSNPYYYNVFVLGNDTQYGTDAQGKVAVGGNAYFNQNGQGYTVGSNMSNTTTNLVVGGNLSDISNTIKGNVVVGQNINLTNPSITGNVSGNGTVTFTNYGTVNGSVKYGTGINNPTTTVSGTTTQGTTVLPVDFTAAATFLQGSSLFYNSLTTTGTTAVAYGGITLTGSKSDLNVFTLSESALASANSLTINAPSGSTVLINITGSADQMQNFGITVNGTDKQHVLYNFYQASTLTFTGVGIQGSVLAPFADINFAGGNIDGTIIGKSIAGSGESHDYLFQGALPNYSNAVAAVPEPASTTAFILGIAGIAALVMRRRKQLAS